MVLTGLFRRLSTHRLTRAKESGKVDATSYVERRDDGYWVTGTRMALDSLVYGFARVRAPIAWRSRSQC
jgi:hypothetical protein